MTFDLSQFSGFLEVSVFANFSYTVLESIRDSAWGRIDRKLSEAELEREKCQADNEMELSGLALGLSNAISKLQRSLDTNLRAFEKFAMAICSLFGSICIILLFAEPAFTISHYINLYLPATASITFVFLLVTPTPIFYLLSLVISYFKCREVDICLNLLKEARQRKIEDNKSDMLEELASTADEQ